METDPVVMAQLGGPVPRAEIPALHRRRLSGLANDPWWLVIVTDDGESAGTIGIWETEHDGSLVHETGWMLLAAFQGRGLASAALGVLLGEEDGGYRDAPLRVNHWVLTLRP